jgi:Mlc titration factor MtfA (ptsG expression regulator)/Flp pilus assembly protein TadD
MPFSWRKNQRRQELLAEPFPPAWADYLVNNVRHYPLLDPARQAIVQAVVTVFAAEKQWEAGTKFRITDEMKVTVAGQAGLLVLGLDEPYYFDRVQSIILYPGAFTAPPQFRRRSVPFWEIAPLAGQAWHHSPILLSWRDVLRCGRNAGNGMNVAVHEFAHHLDGLDGEVDGSPPLSGEQEKTWRRVTEAEYLRLVGSARRREVTLLSHYGAKDRAEFFATATECFFEQPKAMRERHPELYGIMAEFYRQDPAQWLPDAIVSPTSGRSAVGAGAEIDPDQWQTADADELFTLACDSLNERRCDLAEQAVSRAIQINPADGELFQLRALARVHLGLFAQALKDANQALRLDPRDIDAYLARGAAYVGLRQYDAAMDDLNHVLHIDRDNAEAYYYRGLALSGMGQFAQAISDFSASLIKRPLAADAYYQRGLARQKLGLSGDAENDLQKAFQLDPQVDRPTWLRR